MKTFIEWKLVLTISQTCGSTRTLIPKCKHTKHTKLFWRVNEGKKHMFHSSWCSRTNFSIHRLMFFVLSGFLFLDTNCVSVIVCVWVCEWVLHVQCHAAVIVALFVFYNLIGCFTRQLIQFQKDKVNWTDAIVLGQANCTIVYIVRSPFWRSYNMVVRRFFVLLMLALLKKIRYCLLCTIHIVYYGVLKWKVEKLTGSFGIRILLTLSVSLSFLFRSF